MTSGFSMNRVLSGLQWLVSRDLRVLILICVIWTGVDSLFLQFDRQLGIGEGGYLLTTKLLSAPVLAGTVTVMALDTENRGVQPAINLAVSLYFPLLGLSILVGLGTLIGYLFLILPGVALATVWAASTPIMVAEGGGPIHALRESFERIRAQFWPVLGVMIGFLVTAIVANAVLMGVLTGVLGFDPASVPIVSTLIATITAIAGHYLTSAIYLELQYCGGAGSSAP